MTEEKNADLQEELSEETAAETLEEVIEEEAAEENAEKSEKEEKKDKKKEKKEKKDKAAEVEEKYKALVEELNDKALRQIAEFDNYRKRTEKEKQAMFETGAKSVLEKILPIVDNFERGLQNVPEDTEDAFTQGMQMIYKQLMSEMEKLDVKPIEAVGKEFNPDLHNAVMHIEDETVGENVIVQELQKGYTYRDQVIRHSMVQVAN